MYFFCGTRCILVMNYLGYLSIFRMSRAVCSDFCLNNFILNYVAIFKSLVDADGAQEKCEAVSSIP